MKADCGGPRDWTGLYRQDYDLATREAPVEMSLLWGVAGPAWGTRLPQRKPRAF